MKEIFDAACVQVLRKGYFPSFPLDQNGNTAGPKAVYTFLEDPQYLYSSAKLYREYVALQAAQYDELVAERNPKLMTWADLLCWLFALGCGATVGPIAFTLLLGWGVPLAAAAVLGVFFFFVTTTVNVLLARSATRNMVAAFMTRDDLGTQSALGPVFNHSYGALAYFDKQQLLDSRG